ncbi:unnamed protein product [Vitrella brassicaformis CCMP3155]|uniref:JmjC domain-containing protein n=1 Tax=Vitrella brassicaformis (strain CCMP3155) TaxID=1169540 RepID=A0A0G4FXM1_VITBC|nr:unnamed protein product [Vitrella brassicaformis CCMP3155]|eukprot:CEM19611.1 unnamed protein product [Vitrella brassicaformis CCMP3155]
MEPNGIDGDTAAAMEVCVSPGCQFRHRRTAKKITRAKKDHRTDIAPAEWGRYNYAALLNPTARAGGAEALLSCPESVPRVDAKTTSPAEFIASYEMRSRPCIIANAINEWPAMRRWTFDYLEEKWRNGHFKIGEDDRGHRIRVKLKYFVDYMRHQTDDSPLYLFEASAEDSPATMDLIDDWWAPAHFPEDLHNILGDDRRPPWRWFMIGPIRSGTTVHRDPLGTAAWNAVIQGEKRWALLPPELSKRLVKAKMLLRDGEDDEAIDWFHNLLPRLKAFHRAETGQELPIYEGITRRGDVIFVPPRWWHAVLNLSDTISVTQNFVSPANFALAWESMRRSRRLLSCRWLRRLQRFHPDLYSLACRYDREMAMARQVPGSCSSSSSSSSSDSSSDEDEDSTIREQMRRSEARYSAAETEAIRAAYAPARRGSGRVGGTDDGGDSGGVCAGV